MLSGRRHNFWYILCQIDNFFQMAVRRALGFIQVGGGADGAADAAPSPSRFALGRRSQAHAPNKQTTPNRAPKKYRRTFWEEEP